MHESQEILQMCFYAAAVPLHVVVMLFKPFERAFAHPLLSSSVRTLTIAVVLIPCAGKIAVWFWLSKWLWEVST